MPEIRVPCASVTETVPIVVGAAPAIAVFRAGETYYAIENACPHRGAPLSKGLVHAGTIICPLHHFQFNLATGQCRNPKTLAARAYPVHSEGEEIVIELTPAPST